MTELEQWAEILKQATHVRPRKWCGQWVLLAYDRNRDIPLLGSIADSDTAWQVARDSGVSLEEPMI